MLGLTFQEEISMTFGLRDKELITALDSIRKMTQTNIHMGMQWRIENELMKRARCSWINERSILHMIDMRNRAMFERDYQEYKKAQGQL